DYHCSAWDSSLAIYMF
nr:immunoglobulin light chain junction region [Macaca mulatta]MOY07912.1 immunoglobulin light chain junction region [Macaca mulatta]